MDGIFCGISTAETIKMIKARTYEEKDLQYPFFFILSPF